MSSTILTFDIDRYQMFKKSYADRWLNDIKARFPANEKFMLFARYQDKDQFAGKNLSFNEVKYFIKNIYVY